MGAGIYVVLIGLKVIGGKVNAPYEIITLVGLGFLLAGLFVFIHGLLGVVHQAVIKSLKRRYPENPSRWDYSWNPRGIQDLAWKKILKKICPYQTL